MAETALRARLAMLEHELEGLRRAVHSRAAIEQAVGVLVVLNKCSPHDGFRMLVRLSQQYNVKLRRVAKALVELASRTGVERLSDRLDVLLREQSRTEAPSDGEVEQWQPDPADLAALLAAARRLVETEGEDPERAVRDLCRFLVERGWIPPFGMLV